MRTIRTLHALAITFWIAFAFQAVCLADQNAKAEPRAAGEAKAPAKPKAKNKKVAEPAAAPTPELQTATFGTGCFWCTEAVFQQLKGVHRVVSGYSGGELKNPTYKQVSTGLTGHAEVVQITFDPQVITFDTLLEVFWKTHDPTTLNRQGNDFGTQYRSVIFYHTDEQMELAEHYKEKLEEEHAFRKPIVTEITSFSAFYPAENYHQNYFNNNGRQPYCRSIVAPKVDKVRKVFRDQVHPRKSTKAAPD
ncbi:MAG: peptide-methionine (S)-S-oxide reductase MsrA [Planctomycetales bacterium]